MEESNNHGGGASADDADQHGIKGTVKKFGDGDWNDLIKLYKVPDSPEELRKQNKEMKLKITCKLCPNARSVLFLPCRHLSRCSGCIGSSNICPDCNIEGNKKVIVKFGNL